MGLLIASIQKIIEVLSMFHEIKPQDRKLVDSLRNGYISLQVWAFIQRFTYVKKSI